MKKSILFTALVALFLGCSTDNSQIDNNQCTCRAIHYIRTQNGFNGGTPIYVYTQISQEQATQMDCGLDNGEYISIGNSEYIKIQCN